jgi:hypothetical protein
VTQRTPQLATFFLLFLGGCDDGHLRGAVTPSTDGKTYLAVVDDNGGECGPIYVDGRPWKKPLEEPREIRPGVHKIACEPVQGDDGSISFRVPAGVVFRFDYWGP